MAFKKLVSTLLFFSPRLISVQISLYNRQKIKSMETASKLFSFSVALSLRDLDKPFMEHFVKQSILAHPLIIDQIMFL